MGWLCADLYSWFISAGKLTAYNRFRSSYVPRLDGSIKNSSCYQLPAAIGRCHFSH